MDQFIFEDGYGNFCDEQSASVAVIDMEVDRNEYPLANITNFGEYMDLKPPEKPIKKTCKMVKIHPSTGQNWYNKGVESLEKDEDLPHRKEVNLAGRPPKLHEWHKEFLISIVDEKLDLVLDEMLEQLSAQGSEQDEEQFTDILEKIRPLPVYGYATGKRIDDEAKDILTKVLRLPTSVKYLEDEDNFERDLAFDEETFEKIQQARQFQCSNSFKKSKGGQVKSIILGELDDEEICTVRTLSTFISKTAILRKDLPEDHTLFLTYIDSSKNSTSVKPTIITNWVKTAMAETGIDTKEYQVHSIRTASSTKAVELGHSIQEVKKHANWSLNSNTFEKHYFKPSTQSSSSTTISNSIFSTEKRITLEVGVESTRIGLGTTTNTQVDETTTENVIQVHLWYKRFFG
ncbi:hypothetical protein G6F56_008491 [Rhizopus delemar]|nr:hypothetical protein G6F56_008491 [Rhizopus delemar]